MNLRKNIITLIFLSLIFFLFGFTVHKHILEHQLLQNPENNMPLFHQVEKVLEQKYPFKEPNEEEKEYAAITGLVRSYGDRHMAFFPPAKTKVFEEDIAGEFGGAGIEIVYELGYLIVVAPLKNSPAERAGILAEDIIIKIDGEPVAEFDFDTAISKIRGEVGTTLALTILRGSEEEIDITLTREIVKIPILDISEEDEVFIIHFYTFSEQSERAFKQALKDFKKSGKKKLLLDLRNNPGGYLSSSIDIASYFLDEGLVVVEEDDGVDNYKYRSKGYDLLTDTEYEVSLLINNGSASASEIVAAALQHHINAKVYGMTSFGKGSVQELINLPKETSLKVTIAKWLTPDKQEISGKGVYPDVVVEEDLLEKTLELLQAKEE